MKPLRSVVRDALHRRGVFVSRQVPYRLDWHLRELFWRLQINCVLDVGAHWGEYGSYLRTDVGYRGRTVSFEPMRASYERLVARAGSDPNWRCLPLALGERAGPAPLRTFANTAFNSFLPRTDAGQREFGNQLRETDVERVDVQRLDDVLADCVAGIESPRIFLKLDTQGYDQQVIAGAAQSLGNVWALQTEVALTHLYLGAPGLCEAVGALQERGFAPTAFFPVAYQADHVHVIEYDCVMVRKPLPEVGVAA